MTRYHRRILVVDDSPEDRELYRRMLTADPDFAYTIIEAETGEDGLRLCLTERPDCILLDFHLPDQDGLGFLEDFNRDYADADIPIVMLTGQGHEGVAVEAMKLGAQDYLVKGEINTHTLQLAVGNSLEKVSLRRELAMKQAEVEDFAATAAKDLEAPLRRVVGYTEVLKQEIEGKISPRAEECLHLISSHATAMGSLVEELLSYTSSLPHHGKPPEHLDLRVLATHAISWLSEEIERTGVEIEIGEMVDVVADRTSMLQLLLNLISNAVLFGREDSPKVTIQSMYDGGHMTLTVEDNGIGIAEADQQKVFMPLKRLDRTAKNHGHGIGLAKCKKIVERLGGHMSLKSAEGQGSVFYVSIPESSLRLTPMPVGTL